MLKPEQTLGADDHGSIASARGHSLPFIAEVREFGITIPEAARDSAQPSDAQADVLQPSD